MGFYSWFYENGPIGTPTNFNPYSPLSPYYTPRAGVSAEWGR